MTAIVEAIYDNGVLKFMHPLPLKDNTQVVVRIQSKGDLSEGEEREAWLRLSEESLTKEWDSPADDVFHELLNR